MVLSFNKIYKFFSSLMSSNTFFAVPPLNKKMPFRYLLSKILFGRNYQRLTIIKSAKMLPVTSLNVNVILSAYEAINATMYFP